MKNSLIKTAVTGAALALMLTACSSSGGGGTPNASTSAGAAAGGGGGSSSCDNTITKKDLPTVSVWGWYPNMAAVVDNFNQGHDDVQVCWTNAGQGNVEYDKFQTAVTAGTGAPDVVMLEADRIANYVVQKALVDIKSYGYDAVKDNFSAGAWKDVSVGDSVYAAPVDGGPMGMIYRTDVFAKYGISVPTTWDEYRAVGQKLKDAGGPLLGDLGANVPAVMMALEIQKGATPFKYDPTKPADITIHMDDQASKDVLGYWAGLVKDGLVGTQDQFTPEYISGVVGGDYATYISAAWAPGYLSGAGVGKGADAGKFAVAPLPQWDPSNPVSVNWGGSAFAVTTQAKNQALAGEVAFGLYADPASLKDGWTNQIIFPLNQGVLTSDEFLNAKVAFFNGQQANKEVYIPAENAYKGFTYSPFGAFYYASMTTQLGKINNKEIGGADAATELQKTVVAYAKEQGFTVTE
ncbi:ABC transporter substrate-binding protein [Demequina lutea]|uniref:Multiple sugar transport system substrate-binding protein n=1 Tax=Demequina lutea TaxID=431489 RepID=A0A7Y9ZB56_9MICO|nr:extracellular solute-binding protein [Demequina lutea]NYI40091.1 multiple sugar transport system substrate-binding protein [Demequina lutea]